LRLSCVRVRLAVGGGFVCVEGVEGLRGILCLVTCLVMTLLLFPRQAFSIRVHCARL
jgi:hypothetical protein